MQGRKLLGTGDEIHGSKTVNREIGYHISRLEKYDKSLEYFDKAVKENPDDRRTLIGRSTARAKAAQYGGAMEDIGHVLSIDPDDLTAWSVSTRNMYLCAEFEEGLVENLKHASSRQKPEVFKMGVMDCYEAIENCIGERPGRPLRDHFKIIRRLAWKQNYAAHKPFEPTPQTKPKKNKQSPLFKNLYPREESRELVIPHNTKMRTHPAGLSIKESLHSVGSSHDPIPPYPYPYLMKPVQNYTSNIDNFMAEKYLDKMYLDKVFLKHIPNEPGVYGPNKQGAKALKQIAKKCYQTVCNKQELLRARKPFYSIRYQEARVSGALKERQKTELQHQQRVAQKEADIILQEIKDAFTNRQLKDLLVYTEKLRRYVNAKSKRIIPNKGEYLKVIYSTMCQAFYDIYRSNPRKSMYEQNIRIYASLGLPLSRDPSTDSVLVQFKNVFVDYKKRIREYEERLRQAVLPEEICWFYHELSRYHLEQKKYDISRLYARQCILEANNLKNEMWVFNSAMLLCKGDLQQHNKNDAKVDLQLALKSAAKLSDHEKVAFIRQCLDVIENVHFDDRFALKELMDRERKIIEMLSGTNMKEEAANLFSKMAALPPSRRMTVLPGVQLPPQRQPSKSNRARSILPTSSHGEDTV
uniref:Tetratricopeptide repeat protein 25 n=3 Tax=Dendroctonus ponderosae TaxID=77166 RepID=A0AAR5Q779_DENPD